MENKPNTYSHKGFYLVLAALSCILLFVIANAVASVTSMKLGIPAFILLLFFVVFAITAIVQSLRGINEPGTPKKIIGLVASLLFIPVVSFMLLAVAIDLFSA